jgi:hypothetical protein
VLTTAAFAATARAAPSPVTAPHGAESAPAVAFDPKRGRGLVVYQRDNRVFGRFVDATGVPTADAEITIFAEVHDYAGPAIVFKQPQNRFYVAASARDWLSFRDPATGPTRLPRPQGIAVAAFTDAGGRIGAGSVFLRTPAGVRRPVTGVPDLGEVSPSLAANTAPDDASCVTVAWQDQSAPNYLFYQQLSSDLAPRASAAVLVSSGTTKFENVSATFNAEANRFAFAYDVCTGRRCQVGVSSFLAGSGSGLVRTTSPLVAPGIVDANGLRMPSIAFAGAAHRYVVSWAMEKAAYARTLEHAGATAALAWVSPPTRLVRSTGRVCTLGVGGRAIRCQAQAAGRPHVIALGDSRVAILAPSTNNSPTVGVTAPVPYFGSWLFDAGSAAVSAHLELSGAHGIGAGAGTFVSTTGQVLAVWEQTLTPEKIWADARSP